MIRFSIIIPLYNKAHFVQKTIESALCQTVKDFEVIVINDGSTDNSLSVVNGIKDTRIRIFSKENGGVSIARNFGIDKSQNEYIVFLDADDLWEPDFLETIKEMIEQYPQAGSFTTGLTYLDRMGNTHDIVNSNLPKGTVVYVEDYCKALIKEEMYRFCTGTICVKKELFNKTGGFREGIKRGEDLDMWLRLSLVAPIVWKNESKLLVQGLSENNATFNRDSYSYKDEFPYWEWYTYGSSFFLKIYTNRTIINRLLKKNQFRDKICILFKINWWYLFLHLIYHIFKK